MGIKLRPKIGARDKVSRGIHLHYNTLKVGLKEVRRQVGLRDLLMMMQMLILVQKDQMLEEMLIDLAQMLN